MFDRTTGKSACSTGDLHLRILATTDLHCHILPYDYFADCPSDSLGLAGIEALLHELRRDREGVVLLDGGDFLFGSPMADCVLETGAGDGARHPMIEAMNLLGFDAATLGNHDFDQGVPYLSRALRQARFPVLSSNILSARGPTPLLDEHILRPGCILSRRLCDEEGRGCDLRIGLIGFAPPRTVALDSGQPGLAARDMVEAARTHVPEMRRNGADIVIALAHSGPGRTDADASEEENACLLLAQVNGIDAVIGGHTHQVFPGPDFADLPGADCRRATFAGKPAMMSGAFGSHLGCMDLVLRCEAGRARVVGHRVEVHDSTAVPARPAAQRIASHFASDHDATLSYIRREVGETAAPITTLFSSVSPCPAARLICAAKRDFVRRALAESDAAGLPVLAAAAPFRAGGRGGPGHYVDFPEGPILLRHLAEIYPYPNTLRALRVSGAQLRNWLELSAAVFQRITPGAHDQMLLDPEVPSYHFDLVEGLTYSIDVSQPARFRPDGQLADAGARRIRDLRHDGRLVEDSAQFILATNSYRVEAGPGICRRVEVVLKTTMPVRSLIRDFLRRTRPYTPATGPVWRFASLPGTSALFDTAPEALLHSAVPRGLSLAPTGTEVDGFERLRLNF